MYCMNICCEIIYMKIYNNKRWGALHLLENIFNQLEVEEF